MLTILDCDDVLLDWNAGFRSFLEAKGIYTDPSGPDDWDMDTWVGQKAFPLIQEFNASEAFSQLDPLPGAVEFVAGLQNPFILTACSTDPAVVARRRENIKRHFGRVPSICLELGASKKDVLRLFSPGTYFEDNVRHAQDGVAAGHEVVVFERSHNRKYRHLPLNWIARFPCESRFDAQL